MGLKLAQGEAILELGAVASARANAEGFSGRKASPEWSPTDCRPCASLSGWASQPHHHTGRKKKQINDIVQFRLQISVPI